MASFLDPIPQFTPYVQQLPVEAMVQVGMQKQAMYDAGIQKIQSEIDNIAGLDILRQVDRNHLQTKLNELGDKMTMFAAGDFSNFQLVNSISGMTKQVVKDPIVQNAVSSTARVRKEQSAMEKARSEGKSSPNNDAYFLDKVNRYTSSTNLNDSFSDYYVPYTDINKKAVEIAGKVGMDSKKIQQIIDSNGNISSVMTTEEIKTNLPKIQAAMDLLFSDPTVKQQLQIDGWAEYRNATFDQVFEPFQKDYDKSVLKINENKLDIIAKLGAQNLTSEKKEELEKQLKELEMFQNTEAKSYNDILSFAKTNFDKFKQNVYEKSIKDKYIQRFTDTEYSKTYDDNPLVKLQQWQEEMKFKYTQERNDNYYKSQNLKLAISANEREWLKFRGDYEIDPATGKVTKKKEPGKTGGGEEDFYSVWSATNPTESQKVESLNRLYNSIDAVGEMANNTAFSVFKDYMYQLNNGKTKDGKPLTDAILLKAAEDFAKSNNESTNDFLKRFAKSIDVKMKDANLVPSDQTRQKIQLFKDYDKRYTTYQLAVNDAQSGAESYMKDVLKVNMSELPNSKTITLPYTGKTITFSKQDIIDYYYGRSPETFSSDETSQENIKRSSFDRIAKKYGKDVAEELFPVKSRFPTMGEALTLATAYFYNRAVEKEDKFGLFDKIFANKEALQKTTDYKYDKLKGLLLAEDIKNVSFNTKEAMSTAKNKMSGMLANNQLIVRDGDATNALNALNKDNTKVGLTIQPPLYPGEGYKGTANIIDEGKVYTVELTEDYIKNLLNLQELPKPSDSPEELRIKFSPFKSTNVVFPSSSSKAYTTAFYQPEDFPNLAGSPYEVYGDIEQTLNGHTLALYIKNKSTNKFLPTRYLNKQGGAMNIIPLVPSLDAASVKELTKTK